MITSGLVLTLSANPILFGEVQTLLKQHPQLTLGNLNKRWLPLVAETEDISASRDIIDWLGGLPGVDFVDVIQVNFESETLCCPEVQHEH